MTVHNIPFEVADAIASHIASPRDLLSLALTCKWLAAIIIPHHNQFRIIRCSVLEGFRIWILLAKDHTLAQNVRFIDIVPRRASARTVQRSPRVPFAFSPPRAPERLSSIGKAGPSELDVEGPGDVEMQRAAERLFIDALQYTTRLVGFRWANTAGLPLIDSQSDRQKKDVWLCLAMISTLRYVEVMDTKSPIPARTLHDSLVRFIFILSCIFCSLSIIPLRLRFGI